MNDRGVKALAERLGHEDVTAAIRHWSSFRDREAAEGILGTTGLFIADVTKHEPYWSEDGIGCRCGRMRVDDLGRVSFFDHIAQQPSDT